MSLELKKVCYSYSVGTSYEVQALKDISLMIPDGQFIGMVSCFSIRSISFLKAMCCRMSASVP